MARGTVVVIACKFLRDAQVAPFSGVRWPAAGELMAEFAEVCALRARDAALAALAAGTTRERAWQAAWIARRLGL